MLTTRMMRKGEDPQACRTSFSSKALTMGVLKGSSAAVIMLLLFFASLPGAKGVLLGIEEDAFPAATESSVCDISDSNQSKTIVSTVAVNFPTAAWLAKAIKQGAARFKEEKKKKKERGSILRRFWRRVRFWKKRRTRRNSRIQCTKDIAVEEIVTKAFPLISADHCDDVAELQGMFRTLITNGIDYETKNKRSAAYCCGLSDQKLSHICGTGLYDYMSDIPARNEDKEQFCVEFAALMKYRSVKGLEDDESSF